MWFGLRCGCRSLKKLETESGIFRVVGEGGGEGCGMQGEGMERPRIGICCKRRKDERVGKIVVI